MKQRTLRRKVIIREYDFRKVYDEALNTSLYDRASFTPLNQEALEKLKVLEILQGKKHTPIIEANWEDRYPSRLLRELKDYLYDGRYYVWKVSQDEEGYLCVQSRNNTPKTRLGWAVFEKDLWSTL